MIAKILTSASQDFNGVNYNEKKNEQGKSELLVARNFNKLTETATKEDYKDYLRAVASRNARVKNPQFHATLSCKGNEYNMDQMREFALQWVEKMGYGQQPFLIYAHNDTDNNHVHIVSVRVDEQGHKIPDRFERLRSQKALREIMVVDLKEKANKDFDDLSNYNFSSIEQFLLLFEQSGWIVTRTEDSLNLVKGGEVQLSIKKDDIQARIEQNKGVEEDRQRMKQIAAILYKYKAGLNHEDLQDFMKKRFGLELVFHTGKGHTTPYGYTIIDHASRSVYKGSKVLPLAKVLQSPEEQEKARAAALVVDTILQSRDNVSFKDLVTEIKGVGLSVDKKGNVKNADGGILHILQKDDLEKLLYYDRVGESRLFVVNNREEADMLSKIYNIKSADVKITGDKRDFQLAYYYGKLVDSYMLGFNVDAELKDRHIAVQKVGDTVYFVNKYHHDIYSNTEWMHDKKVIVANSFNIKNEEEKAVIAKLYGLKESDITPKHDPQDKPNYYERYMHNYLVGKISDNDLRQKDILAINHNDTIYFVDTKHHTITSEDEFQFSNSQSVATGISLNDTNVIESIAQTILSGFALLMSEHGGLTPDEGSSRAKNLAEKKRRKKQNKL